MELLEKNQSLEVTLGRELNPVRNAPRVIDLDILLFGETVLKDPRLTLPHPRISERPFVLLPLQEIRPDYIS